ncbi:MAG: DUF6978 family protein [Gammaproteobacteria bacterium]
MNFDSLTNNDIKNLIEMPKLIENPSAQWKTFRGSQQRNYTARGNGYLFRLFERQNKKDTDNFSCGLGVVKPDSQLLILLRYNGCSHTHGDIKYACHIHKATEQAIVDGKKAESFATPTDEYRTLKDALYCLCRDANISGLVDLQQPNLFGA